MYKPLVNRQPVEICTVKAWTDESEEALRDCFDSTVWEELCVSHGEVIDSLIGCITDYINFCADNAVPTRTAQCFSNSKPWINLDIKALLKEKKRAFQGTRRS